MADAVNTARTAPSGVLITQRKSSLSNCVARAVQACLCSESELQVLHLSVLSCSQAEDDVQKVYNTGSTPAVLFFDIHAARGRKGFLNLVHRLGNRTLTYKHAIKPNRVEVHAADSAAADLQNQPYIVQVSQSEFKIISKASKDLVPQLVKLQLDTQAHERYLDPEVPDVVAVYMQQSDTLLAASDQGLTAIVKRQHGVRQGNISVSLAKAQIQLSVLHSDGAHELRAVTGIPQAFAILLASDGLRKGFLSAKLILNLNTVHPAAEPMTRPLVTSTSADSYLQQQAMLELLQACRSTEGCDERLLAECISQGGIEALIDKVCDTSTDSTQLAQKLYDVLLLILGTVPATANILQRLQLALQRALQSGSNSLILAQLVLNLMQLPVVRKAARLAAFSHSLAAFLSLQQAASTQIQASSIAAATPTAQTWKFLTVFQGTKRKYNMANQVQQSKGAWSASEPIELSGLSGTKRRPDWQRRHTQAQQDAAALQTKVAIVKSLLYLAPLLQEEPVSMPLIANALVHEVMSSMTASSGTLDPLHDAEHRRVCLATLLVVNSSRLPSIADVMLLEADTTFELPDINKYPSHALLTHIAASIRRIQSLPQDALLLCQCLQLLTEYTQFAFNPQQADLLHVTIGFALEHCHELLLLCGPPHTWTDMVSLAFVKLLQFQTVCLLKACKVGQARTLLGLFVGDNRWMHACRAFATHQLTCQPEDVSTLAVLAFYTAIANLVAACPVWDVNGEEHLTLPGPAQLYQNAHPQTEMDLLSRGSTSSQRRLQDSADCDPIILSNVIRSQAMQLLDFFIQPSSGLGFALLEASMLTQHSMSDLEKKAVELLTAVYSNASSPGIADASCKYCSNLHWTAFKTAYAAGNSDACCLHLGALLAMARHKALSVQHHLLDQNLVGFLLQEISKEINSQFSAAGSNSSAAVTAHSSQEMPARNVSSLLKISRPPNKSTAAPASKSVDLNRLADSLTQPSGSPEIAAQNPSRGAISDRRISRIASPLKSLQASSTASAKPVSSQAHGDLKFPPGFVSTGDLEEDLDRLMEMDSESGSSASTSAAQSPPHSARISARNPLLPPLDLTTSKASLPPLVISTARNPLPTRTPLSSSRPRLTATPGRNILPESLNSLPSQSSTDLEKAGVPGQTDTMLSASTRLSTAVPSARPSPAELPAKSAGRSAADALSPSARQPAAAVASAMLLPGARVPRLSLASQSSTSEAVASMQGGLSSSDNPSTAVLLSTNTSPQQNLLYEDDKLHLQMLQLLLELLLTSSGQLDPAYQPQGPASQGPHPLTVLQHHLSHANNAHLAEPLLRWARAHSPAVLLLLRLTCKYLFDDTLYQDKHRIGRGAFAHVFNCCLPEFCQQRAPVALKVTDLSQVGNGYDSQATALKEISIMQRLRNMAGICQLHDYGITHDSITLVMARYRCSLREWRQRQPAQLQHQLRLYLNIFYRLAMLVQGLSEEQVVHFDLKCDNVLLEPLSGVDEEAFWAPTSDELPFQIVLADFGDSCDFSHSDSKHSSRNRGTECIRAPEMLLMSGSSAEGNPEAHASHAGAACDVWSLGCLLYELIVGSVLFPSEPDWSKFYMTVTDPKQDLFAPHVTAMLQPMPAVMEMLDFILVRNPVLRPTAAEVASRVQGILKGSKHSLPTYCRPVVLPAYSLRSASVPSTPSLPASSPHLTPSRPLTALHPQHLVPISPQLYLGALACLLDPYLLQQAAIRHVIIISSSRKDEGMTPTTGKLPVLGDVLNWLLTESDRARGLAVCTAGGIQCKIIPVPGQVEGQVTESRWSADQLPSIVRHVRELMEASRNRIAITASPGCQEYAAAVAVAHAVQNEGLAPYAALVQLQHAHHQLKAAEVFQLAFQPGASMEVSG